MDEFEVQVGSWDSTAQLRHSVTQNWGILGHWVCSPAGVKSGFWSTLKSWICAFSHARLNTATLKFSFLFLTSVLQGEETETRLWASLAQNPGFVLSSVIEEWVFILSVLYLGFYVLGYSRADLCFLCPWVLLGVSFMSSGALVYG